MKKLILSFGYIFILTISSCYSQLPGTDKKELESQTRVVYGYSKDFNELDLGITFIKDSDSGVSTYYIKFQLYAPNARFRQDIQIRKTSAVTFVSKSDKTVDLPLRNVKSSTENVKQTDYPVAPVISDYSTILIIPVTKEQLIEIGSEPFYKLILPYYKSSSKVENQAIFTHPSLFTRRTFTQKNIKYILDSN